jgi:photosystem II stability/assembly factor-like uncharacterized protein/cell division septation protein DedD
MKKLGTLIPLMLWLAFFDWSGTSRSAHAQSRGFTVQVASRQSEAEALAEMAKLAAAGLPAHIVRANVPGKGVWYRVRYGRFGTLAEAQLNAERSHKRGTISDYIVTLYETPMTSSAARREAVATTETAPPAIEPSTSAKSAAKEPRLGEKSKTPALTGETVKAPAAKEPATKVSALKETAKESGKNGAAKAGEKATTAKNPVTTTTDTKPAELESAVAAPPVALPPTKESKPVQVKTETAAAVAGQPEPGAEFNSDKPTSASGASESENTLDASLAKNKTTTRAAAPDKVSPVPRITQPPLPDALGELDIANRNWKVVRRSSATDKNLRAIFFVDSMTGWAAGDAGAVYRTTDGGKAWKPLLSGAAANINQIFFVDWNNGWMLGEMTRKDTGEAETVLLSTTNGGRSWQKKPLPQVLSIFFTDAQHGWAVGKNATILRTEDGGNEWKTTGEAEKVIGHPVESSNYNFGFRDVFFLDAQHGWLIGNFYGRAKSNIGGLFVTTDGGATWKRVPMTVQTKFSSGRFTPGTLFSVHFTEPNIGTVTGEMFDNDERFFFSLHTRDGGKSWEQYRTPSRAAHSTQFLDPVQGWTAASAPREGGADAVVYDTTLMRTDNGGASWRYDFVARGSRIRGVFFLSANKGWAVGDRGMILRYEDKTKSN